MKNCYFWATPSGPINLIKGDDMPVKPIKPPDEIPTYAGTLCIGGDVFGYEKELKKYESTLQRAKASSVPIQDQDRAAEMIHIYCLGTRGSTNKPDPKIKPGTIYGPFTVEYHKEITCNRDCPGSCFHPSNCDTKTRTEIAILLPEKEPQEDNIESLRKELAECKQAYNQQLKRNTAIAKDLEYWAQRSADYLRELEKLRKQ